MTRHRLAALVSLTGVWVRSTQTRRAALILAAAITVVTAVSLSVSALTLTGEQERTRDFGRYQQSSYLSLHPGDLAPGTITRIRAAVGVAAPQSAVWIGSNTLRPDSYTKFFFLAPTSTVQYLEGADPRHAHPDRYLLDSGRWPASPREVVVSRHLLTALPDPHTFTVLSGRTRMTIVGTVTDRYATDGDLILAGSGTWESLKPLPAARQYQPIDGQLQLRWNPPATVSRIAAAVTATLPTPLLDQGPGDAITGNLARRTDPRSTDDSTADRAGVSPVPLLLIVLLVAVLAATTTRRPNQIAGATLTSIGVRPWAVRGTQALAALAATAVAAAGMGLGWIAAILTRTLVLSRTATQPLAPAVPPGRDLLLIAAAGIAVVTIGSLLPARSSPTATTNSRVRSLLARLLRWLIAAAAIVAGTTQTGPTAPYLLLVGVLLLAPDLLHLLRTLLPRARPRGLVTRGLMHTAAPRQAAAVIVIGACVATPLLVAAQLASRQASDATYTFSTVPAGQIWVERIGTTGNVRGVARALATIPSFPSPVAVRDLTAPPNRDGSAGAQARFPRTVTGGTAFLVIPSSDALHRLLGNALPTTAAATLDRGGVLDFLTDRGAQRLAVYANGGELQTTTAPLPTQHVSVARAWRAQFSGAILTRTARTLDLPLSTPVKYLYPDITPTQIQQAVDATTRAGYDSDFVHYTVPPPPPVLPVTALVFFAGLTLGGLIVLLVTITDQTRRLRTYSSRLIAIGLTPAWTRSLLTLQTALITTAGLTTGIAAGLAALHQATRSYPLTVVPVLPAITTSATTVLAALVITLAAARNLTARSSRP